jgi:hypothetical protein
MVRIRLLQRGLRCGLGKVLRRIAGLSEPQSVAYVPFADSVFVANAGDGSVRVLRAEDLTPIGRIALKRIVVDAY